MGLIDVITSKENLNRAYKKVVENKGAGGIDGMKVEELGAYIKDNKDEIIHSIRNRTYMPKPVRRVYIPKDNGKQAREGKWNGGFAPYGYELVNGELQIAEDEAELIRLIYDKFIHTNMETRLYRLYDEIEGVENSIEEVKNRLLNIQQQKISEENVYQFLLYFDKLYDKFTDLEKKEFLNSFVEQVDIYEQEQPDGRFLKHIKFRFPVYFGDRETQELCWDNESTVETVCKLVRK